MNITPTSYLVVKSEQHIKQLYIGWLYILEDLKNDGKITELEFAYYRKRVLDIGNTKIREFKEELEKFTIS